MRVSFYTLTCTNSRQQACTAAIINSDGIIHFGGDSVRHTCIHNFTPCILWTSHFITYVRRSCLYRRITTFSYSRPINSQAASIMPTYKAYHIWNVHPIRLLPPKKCLYSNASFISSHGSPSLVCVFI